MEAELFFVFLLVGTMLLCPLYDILGIGTTVPFVKMIREKGIKPNAIGVEVISDANLEKGIEYAAKHTYENTKKVLEEAWPEVL